MATIMTVPSDPCSHGDAAVPYFAYRRIVSLEETNATGNTYFSQYVKWQGHCREMFLKVTAEWVVRELGTRFALVTTEATVTYLEETEAFDELCIHLYSSSAAQNRMNLEFEYWRLNSDRDGRDELVARGHQQLAWLERREDGQMHPRPVPARLLTAIDEYIEGRFTAA